MPPDDKNKPAKVSGDKDATVQAVPAEYFKHKKLNLHFTSAKDFSIDNTGATKSQKANTPLNYVEQLQDDLKTLKYLPKGAKSDGRYSAKVKRAVQRFQRHALRVIRTSGGSPADEGAAVFKGTETGTCDHATATEIRRWVDKPFELPLGRFKLVPLTAPNTGPGGSTAKLREDAAAVWDKIIAKITAAGAFVGGTTKKPYGDSTRALKALAKGTKKGASSRSLHHAGRAVDLNQDLGSRSKTQKIFIQRDGAFWRLWGRVDKPNGTPKKKGELVCFDFGASRVGKKTDYNNPAGNYVDLTDLITKGTGFVRIKPQAKFPAVPDAAEWWHFQFTKGLQPTFLDEVELIGKSEDDLLGLGWSIEKMDLPPG